MSTNSAVNAPGAGVVSPARAIDLAAIDAPGDSNQTGIIGAIAGATASQAAAASQPGAASSEPAGHDIDSQQQPGQDSDEPGVTVAGGDGAPVAWCAGDDDAGSDLQTTGPPLCDDGRTGMSHSDSGDTKIAYPKNMNRFGEELSYSPEERWRKRLHIIEDAMQSEEAIEDETFYGYSKELMHFCTQMVDVRLRLRANECIRRMMNGDIKGEKVNTLMRCMLALQGFTIETWAENQLAIVKQKRDWKAKQRALDRIAMVLGAHGFADKAKEIAGSITNNHTQININISQTDAQEGAERGAKYGNLIR